MSAHYYTKGADAAICGFGVKEHQARIIAGADEYFTSLKGDVTCDACLALMESAEKRVKAESDRAGKRKYYERLKKAKEGKR